MSYFSICLFDIPDVFDKGFAGLHVFVIFVVCKSMLIVKILRVVEMYILSLIKLVLPLLSLRRPTSCNEHTRRGHCFPRSKKDLLIRNFGKVHFFYYHASSLSNNKCMLVHG
jgi:hypothetical protein